MSQTEEWIPLSDKRRPDRNEQVMIKTRTGERIATYKPSCYDMDFLKKYNINWVVDDNNGQLTEVVVAWRPLSIF